MLTKAFQNHGANLKRWLGLLLVVFILYGTTVEAAHRHGKVSPSSNHATCVGADPVSSSSNTNAKPGCNDCLICQLHQNFSATLISFKLNTEPLRRLAPSRSSVPVLISSITHTPQSGRAPPQPY
jgi:Protein of unknown function (DUF2946)